MKRISFNLMGVLCILFSTCFYACSEKRTLNSDYEIIPKPLDVNCKGDASFLLKDGVAVIYPENNQKMQDNAEFLVDYVEKQTGVKLTSHAGMPVDGAICLTLDLSDDNAEAYKLIVNDKRVCISGASEAGVFYGIQTLRKSLPVAQDINVNLSAVEIYDKPRFAYRGAMLDVARHFYTVDEVKTFIDMLALHNINRFHWHLTDDQGWRIEIKKYPKLMSVASERKETVVGRWYSGIYDGKPYGGYYTQDELRDVIDYAAKRHITIIPEVDLPGHMQAALTAYPELGCTGGPYEVRTIWGVSQDVLCVGNDFTLQFVKDVLSEVADIFPSEYIHIGGDECPKVRWEKCPKCQERIKSLGLKSDAKHTKEQRLQSYMIQEAAKYLKEKGKRIIGWTEILEGGLVPDATLMSWIGESGGIEAAHQHHDVIMTPNTYLYFDYYQSKKVEDEPLAIGGYLPIEKTYNYEPMPKELTEEEQQYIKGVQANLWTEYIPIFSQVQYMVLPRLGAAAEVQWTDPSKKDYKDFLRRVPHLVAVYDCYGWNYATHVYDVNVDMKADTVNHVLNVQLSTMADDPIYYTLDGQDPTEKSLKYTKPFTIDQSVVLKTMAVHPDRTSKISVDAIRFNKATLKPVVLLQPNESRFSPDGPVVLVDGRNGNHSFDTGAWLAVAGNDLEAVINMQAETILSSASVHVYVRKDAWLFDARGFSVSVSSDNKNYKEVASQEYKQMQESDSDGIIEHELSFDPCKATYVKIKVISEKSMPDWHWDAGKAPFLLVDEIILN
ncbi:family 20 glycosylhydrolase [Phocaeicola coprocola]|uniref:glycoside hydrolase family 20 protein n=1 Tax=Phocaeicola coprocola TaxID=310298 RepID=UPI001C38E02B|nr:family 20 glycosylhydrolase [Phocaeicola coprocola]MBV3867387.1 family 20 glycosylhydrolase [Phocaeicola coprocola]MBV4008546.1 family 20 glycosylhydrolase [Phocaeicola coprocola]MBV4033111.1 family 20 glycosylhydrolase [Phocaeicola coprocola]MBV4039667.1 family 20 glycosylhydrolase [Phocaeicola coprocola]MBV4061247.1 family 20 glycosylhydrolase [Phocaeicola coprocola]